MINRHSFLVKVTLSLDDEKCPPDQVQDIEDWGVDTFLEELPTEIAKGVTVQDARLPSPQEVLGKLALL